VLPGALVSRELARGVPDPAPGDAGVGDAGEPLAGVLRGSQIQGPLDDPHRTGQQHVPYERHRPLFQDASGPSGLVKDDPAAADLLIQVRQNGGAPQALAAAGSLADAQPLR
jgi:hypothetical protein